MPLRGQGALVIWRSVTSEADEDALRWHNTEHMAERCAVPGFLRGRRYVSVAPPKQYLDFYETETSETIRSEPYLARLNNPTPWTQRVLPHFRGTFRVGCRVLVSTSRGLAGVMATLRLRPAEGRAGALKAWLTGPALEAMRAPAGVAGMHVLETAPETTRVRTAEGKLKGGELAPAEDPWPLVVLVECTDPELAESLPRGLLQAERLVEAGAEPGAIVWGIYRLQLTMDPE